uniref:bis(5'-adenosyl)-triphosphatase n=1 Tax=Heterorhabditis bacteriophora TaxID=37862 RepID=A0A1I7XR52_HETBA
MLSSIGVALRKAMSSSAYKRSLIAVCQLTSDNDIKGNFETCKEMIERASERKCKMVFFPECFDFIGRDKDEQITLAMDENGDYIERYRALARQHGLWLSLGGMHHKDMTDPLKPWNTHLIIDCEGNTRAEYKKLHLFDLEIPGKVRLLESEFSKAGTKMVHPVDTPIGRLGLSICYDLRFAELSLWNRNKGAQVLSFPSAFTLNTGLAHWEYYIVVTIHLEYSHTLNIIVSLFISTFKKVFFLTLLRTRAIETQSQTGKHNEKRISYGHAMVVDPWGAVIAQCSERIGMCFAEIDLQYVDELRAMQPVFSHRRHDLYTLHVNECDLDDSVLMFSEFPIASECIFYRSALSFAFVNLKPVLNGHVLISPKRPALRLTDLTDAETADLFIVAKKVQKMLEKVHGATSSTICVQDGPAAGQTVKHVHIHILVRRSGDFGPTPDNLYSDLAAHDRNPEICPRTHEEMSTEAYIYREAIRNM